MSLLLEKGQSLNLTPDGSGLEYVIVGLGWDELSAEEQIRESLLLSLEDEDFGLDCDAFALLLKDGKLTQGMGDVVYYKNLKHKSESVKHMGDNLTGHGKGDDEQIEIKIKKVPEEYNKIIVGMYIWQAKERKHHLGMLENSYIRVLNEANYNEICRYKFSDDYNGKTALICGELVRNNNKWSFTTIGKPVIADNFENILSLYR